MKILGPTHIIVGLEEMQEQNKIDRQILQGMLKRNKKDRRYIAKVIDYLSQ